VGGIEAKKSVEKPIANARSIAELFGHLIAWNEIVARRVAEEAFEVTEELDFPDVSKTKWPDLLKRFEAAHAKLVENVSRLKDADLERTVPGKKHSFAAELHGLMHHNTYHSAQIALLKKS
jgi:uncharacterized damage-inducible protein DinB